MWDSMNEIAGQAAAMASEAAESTQKGAKRTKYHAEIMFLDGVISDHKKEVHHTSCSTTFGSGNV